MPRNIFSTGETSGMASAIRKPVTLLVVPGWSGAGPVAVGTGVLPLSLDDPGAKVTCGSRALVTADKGNDPLCVRSFAGVGAGSGRPPAGPAPMQREVAGEMDIEDIEVFIGTGRR